MQLKILLEKIQEEVSKNPDILELEVYIQDIDSDENIAFISMFYFKPEG